MEKMYRRPISPLEKIFLAKVDLESGQQFTNQGIIEGIGVFDVEKWKEAVRAASIAHVASRVTLQRKNFLYYWTESDSFPTIRVISDSQWDAMSSKGIEYFPDFLCPINGPVCEVILVDGVKTKRVIVNTLHAAMDGMGTVLWGADIFRHLRGEPLVGSNSTTTDIDIAKKFNVRVSLSQKDDYISPFYKTQSSEKGGFWVRKIIPNLVSKIIPKICKVIAEESWVHMDGKVRVLVPVDLRRRMDNLMAVGNLTGYLYMDIEKSQTIRDVNLNLIKQLRNYSDCYMPRILKMMRFLPARMIHQGFVDKDKKSAISGNYLCSGMISHLGRLTANHMDAGAFKGQSWFSINSMSGPGVPCVTITVSEILFGDKKHCNLIVGAPKAQTTFDELDIFSNRIVNAL